MDLYEMRRLDLLDLRESLGRGAYKQMSEKTGIDPSYLSRCAYPQGKLGKKNIGDDTVKALDEAYPGWRKREINKIIATVDESKRKKVAEMFPVYARSKGITGTSLAESSSDADVRQDMDEQTRRIPMLSARQVLQGAAEGEQLDTILAHTLPDAFALRASELATPRDRYNIDKEMILIIEPSLPLEHGKPFLVIDENGNLSIRRYEEVGSQAVFTYVDGHFGSVPYTDCEVIGRLISEQKSHL